MARIPAVRFIALALFAIVLLTVVGVAIVAWRANQDDLCNCGPGYQGLPPTISTVSPTPIDTPYTTPAAP